jgi:hypothetical protein
MRIPNDRPAGLPGLFFHRPHKLERRLIAEDAAAAAAYAERPTDANADRAEVAANDLSSYLANVWMPRHPVRAAVESRLQERGDRRRAERLRQGSISEAAALEPDHMGQPEPEAGG